VGREEGRGYMSPRKENLNAHDWLVQGFALALKNREKQRVERGEGQIHGGWGGEEEKQLFGENGGAWSHEVGGVFRKKTAKKTEKLDEKERGKDAAASSRTKSREHRFYRKNKKGSRFERLRGEGGERSAASGDKGAIVPGISGSRGTEVRDLSVTSSSVSVMVRWRGGWEEKGTFDSKRKRSQRMKKKGR